MSKNTICASVSHICSYSRPLLRWKWLLASVAHSKSPFASFKQSAAALQHCLAGHSVIPSTFPSVTQTVQQYYAPALLCRRLVSLRSEREYAIVHFSQVMHGLEDRSHCFIGPPMAYWFLFICSICSELGGAPAPHKKAILFIWVMSWWSGPIRSRAKKWKERKWKEESDGERAGLLPLMKTTQAAEYEPIYWPSTVTLSRHGV